MYIGEVSTKQLISVALMILFTMAAMFFMGYKYAYTKAINYANEQITKEVDAFKAIYGIVNQEENTDFILPSFGGVEDE